MKLFQHLMILFVVTAGMATAAAAGEFDKHIGGLVPPDHLALPPGLELPKNPYCGEQIGQLKEAISEAEGENRGRLSKSDKRALVRKLYQWHNELWETRKQCRSGHKHYQIDDEEG